MKMSGAIRQQLAPNGLLRASINLGNPVLARRDSPETPPYGVSIDIARALAERLGVAVRFVVFDAASHSVDAVANDLADIGFFAIDPKRGETIAFTDAYLHIEGWYAVHTDSPITTVRGIPHGEHGCHGTPSRPRWMATCPGRHRAQLRSPRRRIQRS